MLIASNYGTTFIADGGFESNDSRLDKYLPHGHSTGHYDRCTVDSNKDFSRPVVFDDYNDLCTCCFLGFNHSLDFHNASIARKK